MELLTSEFTHCLPDQRRQHVVFRDKSSITCQSRAAFRESFPISPFRESFPISAFRESFPISAFRESYLITTLSILCTIKEQFLTRSMKEDFFLCWIIKVWDYQRSDKIGIDGQLHRLTFEQFPTHDESV